MDPPPPSVAEAVTVALHCLRESCINQCRLQSICGWSA